MINGRTLYLLHVPKCGGIAVNYTIYKTLNENGIPWYPATRSLEGQLLHRNNFNDYAYIQGHLGTYPIGLVDNLDVAYICRNPVDRSISNFAWLWMTNVIQSKEDYLDIEDISEKLKHYLFNDEFYFPHRNIQSRFICNKPSDNTFKYMFDREFLTQEELAACELEKNSHVNKTQNWYIPDTNTSIEYAKSQIDSFNILGTTDNHDQFVEKVVDWFQENYQIDSRAEDYEYRIKTGIKINESKLNINDSETINTEDLKSMLSAKEIKKIETNNNLDMEIYLYVKSKLGYV